MLFRSLSDAVGQSIKQTLKKKIPLLMEIFKYTEKLLEFSGGLVVKTPDFHYRGHGFDSSSGDKDSATYRTHASHLPL